MASSSLPSQAVAAAAAGVPREEGQAEEATALTTSEAAASLLSFPLLVLELVTSLLGTRDMLSLVCASKRCVSQIGPAVVDLDLREAMDDCYLFSDAQLCALLRTFRNLRRLDLDECDVTDAGLIKALALGRLPAAAGEGGDGGEGHGRGGGEAGGVGGDEEQGSTRATPPLTFLNLCLNEVRKDGLIAISRSPVLQQTLLTLNLAECPVGDCGAKELRHLRALERLSLATCHNITDETLIKIAEGPGCRRLVYLDLETSRITNRGLKPLTKALRQLVSLNLWGCHCIMNTALESLATLPNLRNLDLSGCLLLSDGGLRSLARGCPKLQQLSLAGCSQLGDGTAEAIVGLEPEVQGGESQTEASLLRQASTLDRTAPSAELTAARGAAAGASATGATHSSSSQSYGFCKTLKTLDVASTGLTDDGVSLFRHLSVLEELNVAGTNVSRESLRALEDLRLRVSTTTSTQRRLTTI